MKLTDEQIHEIASSYMEVDADVYVSFLPSNLDKFARALLDSRAIPVPQDGDERAVQEFRVDEIVDYALGGFAEHTSNKQSHLKMHRVALAEIVNHFVALASNKAAAVAVEKGEGK